MIALKVPSDSLGTKMVLGPQVYDLLDKFRWDLPWVAPGDRFLAE